MGGASTTNRAAWRSSRMREAKIRSPKGARSTRKRDQNSCILVRGAHLSHRKSTDELQRAVWRDEQPRKHTTANHSPSPSHPPAREGDGDNNCCWCKLQEVHYHEQLRTHCSSPQLLTALVFCLCLCFCFYFCFCFCFCFCLCSCFCLHCFTG